MSIVLRTLVVVLCLLFFFYVVRLVSKGRLLLKYSLIWMLLTLVTLLFSLFPEPLYGLSKLLGFENPSNFIFLIGLFFLAAIALSLSVIVSWQSEYIKALVQDIALLGEKHEK